LRIEIENNEKYRCTLTNDDRFYQFELEFELETSAFFATLRFLSIDGGRA